MNIALPVDHVGFVAHDLDKLLRFFSRLGFLVTTPDELMGESAPLGQRSAHAVFKQGYLEFTAPTGENPNNHLYPLLKKHEGAQILALATDSAGVSLLSLAPQMLAHQDPMEASREVTYGQRAGLARFRWFALDAECFPHALVCFAEHLDPHIVFQAEVSQHPNTVIALTGVGFAGDPDCVSHYQQLRRSSTCVPDHIYPQGRVYRCDLDHLMPAGQHPAWISTVDFLVEDINALREILAIESIEFITRDTWQISIDCPWLHCRLNFLQAS